MDWFFYAVALPVAALFLASAVYALYWASRNGQLRDFERGAESIFDESEPVGRPTDAFPGKTPPRPSARHS
jgi:cbb3-type cytochrome oxidase maturation protein